jgi:hypothetical protein
MINNKDFWDEIDSFTESLQKWQLYISQLFHNN